MSFRAAVAVLVVTLGAALASAAELTELGNGLNYLRLRTLPESSQPLAAALNNGRPLVLDLRATTIDPERREAAQQVASAIAARTTHQPLFLLVSPKTPPGLLPVKLPSSSLLLGVAGSQPKPHVVVAQPADADQRAYGAAESGLDLEALVTGKIEKERFDEASLVREFQNGNYSAEPPPTPDPAAKSAPEKAPVLTDRVLQRAIHIHRALAALKARSS